MAAAQKRVEKAQENLEKARKQAAKTREELVKQLQQTARRLRGEVDSLELDSRTRAEQVAHEMEKMAQNIEKQTEKRLGNVRRTARDKPWQTIGLAFLAGLLVGILVKLMK